jgi:hypothetical protein
MPCTLGVSWFCVLHVRIICMHICTPICTCICTPVCTPICTFVCTPICTPVCPPICTPICTPVCTVLVCMHSVYYTVWCCTPCSSLHESHVLPSDAWEWSKGRVQSHASATRWVITTLCEGCRLKMTAIDVSFALLVCRVYCVRCCLLDRITLSCVSFSIYEGCPSVS